MDKIVAGTHSFAPAGKECHHWDRKGVLTVHNQIGNRTKKEGPRLLRRGPYKKRD